MKPFDVEELKKRLAHRVDQVEIRRRCADEHWDRDALQKWEHILNLLAAIQKDVIEIEEAADVP